MRSIQSAKETQHLYRKPKILERSAKSRTAVIPALNMMRVEPMSAMRKLHRSIVQIDQWPQRAASYDDNRLVSGVCHEAEIGSKEPTPPARRDCLCYGRV